MSVHDAVLEHKERIVRLVESSPNKRAMCRRLGIHHSTYYRWRRGVLSGFSARAARGVSWRTQYVQSQVVAQALANPQLGPQRLADRLAATGIEVSASTVWRILVGRKLNTRRLRYRILKAHLAHPEEPVIVAAQPQRWVGVLDASVPGDLVQLDCFQVGSFKETRLGESKKLHGVVWQYTAIDVASSYVWVTVASSAHNPTVENTIGLVRRVAADLSNWGWEWKGASTDNGNEFRSGQFQEVMAALGVNHRFIRAGRPQSNGKVERVQGTILEEFYKPTLIKYVQPSITGLRRDLDAYINYYNYQRPHHGKWNKGQTPSQIIHPKTKLIP